MTVKAKIRTLVVEDEPLARATLRDFLSEADWLDLVGEVADGRDAVPVIDEVRPDLVFLDIKLPGLTGLEVLKKIKHHPEVVFTTAYDDHAVTAFELGALDYILKPFGRERFHQMLERVRRRITESRDNNDEQDLSIIKRLLDLKEGTDNQYLRNFFVRDGRGRIVAIRVTEIVRLAGAGDYVEIHLDNNATYLLRITLSEFEKRLDPRHFRRIHRSAIVNLDRIVSFKPIRRRQKSSGPLIDSQVRDRA